MTDLEELIDQVMGEGVNYHIEEGYFDVKAATRADPEAGRLVAEAYRLYGEYRVVCDKLNQRVDELIPPE